MRTWPLKIQRRDSYVAIRSGSVACERFQLDERVRPRSLCMPFRHAGVSSPARANDVPCRTPLTHTAHQIFVWLHHICLSSIVLSELALFQGVEMYAPQNYSPARKQSTPGHRILDKIFLLVQVYRVIVSATSVQGDNQDPIRALHTFRAHRQTEGTPELRRPWWSGPEMP